MWDRVFDFFQGNLGGKVLRHFSDYMCSNYMELRGSYHVTPFKGKLEMPMGCITNIWYNILDVNI